MRAILSAFVICALAPAANAKCAMWGLSPSVLTKSGAQIAPDGGLLVGAIDAEDGTLAPGDAAAQAGWRVRYGSRVASPVLVTLAPGLVLYKLPADAKDAQLIDDKRATVGKVTIGPKTALLGAPKLKKVAHEANVGKRPSARVDVELAGPAPEGAVALVLADAKGAPRSWGTVTAAATTVRAYDRGRCRVLANGTIESKPGDRVIAYWVDASGRTSAASNAISVTGATNPIEED